MIEKFQKCQTHVSVYLQISHISQFFYKKRHLIMIIMVIYLGTWYMICPKKFTYSRLLVVADGCSSVDNVECYFCTILIDLHAQSRFAFSLSSVQELFRGLNLMKYYFVLIPIQVQIFGHSNFPPFWRAFACRTAEAVSYCKNPRLNLAIQAFIKTLKVTHWTSCINKISV